MIRLTRMCFMSAAALLVLVAVARPANAQGALTTPERAALKLLGESAVVRRAIEAELGTAAAAALFGKPAAEVGEFAINNDRVAQSLASSLTDRNHQQEWAGYVNWLRLSEDKTGNAGLFLSRPALGNLGDASKADALAGTGVNRQSGRTFSITPLGDVKLEPSVTVPILTYKGQTVQWKVDSIPAGKVIAGSGLAYEVCDQECLKRLTDRVGLFTKAFGSDPGTPKP